MQHAGRLAARVLLPVLTRHLPVGRITLIGLYTHLVMLLAVALAPKLWSGIVPIGAWDLCNTLIVINGIALRQQVTPDHLQARVNTPRGWSRGAASRSARR